VLFVDFRVFVVAFRQELEQLATMSREQFLAGRDSQDIACYRLLVTIDAAIAFCYHVSTRRFRNARGGIEETWLADLQNERVDVFTHPTPQGYQASRQFRRGGRLASQALPAASLLVDDMLGAIGPKD